MSRGVEQLSAVVLAAGEGRRLRPLTDLWPKAILPVDGRPVVTLLLGELRAAGIEKVVIVTGYLAEEVESLVGDGSAFGLAARYVRQPTPLGSADAVGRAVASGVAAPCLAVAADTVFRPGDIAHAAADWLSSQLDGGLGVRLCTPEELGERSAVRVVDGRVLEVIEKPTLPTPAPVLSGAPLWFLGHALVPLLENLPGPPFELAEAFRRAVDLGLEVVALRLGRTRDLTRPADVIRHNFPYLSTRQ